MAGLLLISTHATAQVSPGTQQVGITLGLANPLSNLNVGGDSERFGEVGPAFGFNYLYQIRRQLSLGGDFNYKSFSANNASTGRYGQVNINPSAWTLLAIGRCDLLPDNNVRPYGLLGLGVGGARREVNYPGGSLSETSNGIAFALGAGLDYDINASWLAGAELRYSFIDTSYNEIGTDRVSSFDILFKAGYKF